MSSFDIANCSINEKIVYLIINYNHNEISIYKRRNGKQYPVVTSKRQIPYTGSQDVSVNPFLIIFLEVEKGFMLLILFC